LSLCLYVGATGPAGRPGATGHTGQRNAAQGPSAPAPSRTDCDVDQPIGESTSAQTLHVAMCAKLM